MKKVDAWLLISEISYKNKTANGYIAEILNKSRNEYNINLEIKNIHKFKVVCGSHNELYYDNKKVINLPKYAIIRRYEIYLCRQLELMGVIVLNSVSSMVDARNKMKIHQILAANNIKTPKTVFTAFKNNLSNIEYEDISKILNSKIFILKWIYGSQGKHVHMINNKDMFDKLIKKYNGRVLCQEYIKESYGKDIRAYVINGKFIGAALRQSDGHTFKSNLAQGGEALEIEYSSEIINISEKAANAVGLDICGVDILIGKDDYYICEVNALPGFKSIKKVSNIDEKDILLGVIRDKMANI